MANTPATPGTPMPTTIRLGRCLGVEVFASGLYRGSAWTNDELDQMVRNFWKLGPMGLKLLNPPAVVGHEESQDFLERTDLPAAGWLTSLRRVGDILVGDITGVPEAIANLINARLYRKVSAEIYDDFVDDFGTSYGLAVRRISILGGEIPQVKRLEDIPLVTFSEAKPQRPYTIKRLRTELSPRRGTWISFSEVSPMNRDQAIAAVKACFPNLDQAVIDTMTDDQLIALAGCCMPPTPAPAPAPVEMSEPSRDQLITELVALGQDPAVLGPMTDDQIKELYTSLTGVALCGPAPAPAVPMSDPAPAPAPAPAQTRADMIAALVAAGNDAASLESKTDQELADMVAKLNAPAPNPVADAAMANAMKKITKCSEDAQKTLQAMNRRILEENRKLEASKKALKKQLAETFAEKLVNEGKITPALKPAVIVELLHSDDSKVIKFTENGTTVDTTEFERVKARYDASPVIVKFGEKLKGSPSGVEDEEKKVKAFALAKLPGKTGENFVHGFSEAKKKKPSLTATEWGVPADFQS